MDIWRVFDSCSSAATTVTGLSGRRLPANGNAHEHRSGGIIGGNLLGQRALKCALLLDRHRVRVRLHENRTRALTATV